MLARVEKSYSAAQPYYPTQLTLTGRSAAAESWQLLGRELYRTEAPADYTGTTEIDYLPLYIGRVTLPGVIQRTTTWETAATPLPLQRVHRPSTGPAGPAGHSCTGSSRTLSSKQNAAVSTQERMPRPAL